MTQSFPNYNDNFNNNTIMTESMHGMIIDAGSTGSRLHVYEFEPRVISPQVDAFELKQALSGTKLTLPTTHSQWTERLSPGLSAFAATPESQLICELANYFKPLLEFATNLLHNKAHRFHQFPIYLRATAGMRILPSAQRDALMAAVRTVLSPDFNQCGFSPLNPFMFQNTHASVLSGEEEAVYGWAGVNYLMGTLLPTPGLESTPGLDSTPQTTTTYGALDMGGASTQISFIHSSKDILSNLFNFHLGGTQHWGVYVNSFLHFGINEAYDRVSARLVFEHDQDQAELFDDANSLSVPSPCLPGGASTTFTSTIRIQPFNPPTDQFLAQQFTITPAATRVVNTDQPYTVTLANRANRGNFDQCAGLAQTLLLPSQGHHDSAWCAQNECSVSGSYQPSLPTKGHLQSSETWVEFVAFSAYNHVWDFLKLPSRATIKQLRDAGRRICNMSLSQLQQYNSQLSTPLLQQHHLLQMCFRSAYTYEILHHGYGFQITDHVTCLKTLQGREMGWALGAMLYEINTLPWQYLDPMASPSPSISPGPHIALHSPTPFQWMQHPLSQLFALSFFLLLCLFLRISRQLNHQKSMLQQDTSNFKCASHLV